jgi:hypothetical protein
MYLYTAQQVTRAAVWVQTDHVSQENQASGTVPRHIRQEACAKPLIHSIQNLEQDTSRVTDSGG